MNMSKIGIVIIACVSIRRLVAFSVYEKVDYYLDAHVDKSNVNTVLLETFIVLKIFARECPKDKIFDVHFYFYHLVIL